MRFLLLIYVLLQFVACSNSYLKKPFCLDTLKEFPDSYVGKYQSMGSAADTRFNNAPKYSMVELEIKKKGIGVPGGIIPLEFWPDFARMNICEIDGAIFLEEYKTSGGYSVYRMEVSNEGLSIGSLNFIPEKLVQKNVTFITPPTSMSVNNNVESVERIAWSSSGLQSTDIYIDNSNLSIQDVLSLSVISSLKISYEKVTSFSSNGRKKVKFLSLDEFARLRK